MKLLISLIIAIVVTSCSPITTNIQTTYNDVYKKNQLNIIVQDKNKLPIENVSIYVGYNSSKMITNLIDEVTITPIKTDSNGKATLTHSKQWNQTVKDNAKCILKSKELFCTEELVEGFVSEEYVYINKSGFKEQKIFYLSIINCNILGATCQTVELENGNKQFVINLVIDLESI
ncbi:hypothetical protein [Marinicellulosiphila megalodicopiae]|uniref:hypothetical protein n=1 Tax=Marinicellulosiphila megalodicopiae TaxID=2724896 RepID=UPI003BAFA5E8